VGVHGPGVSVFGLPDVDIMNWAIFPCKRHYNLENKVREQILCDFLHYKVETEKARCPHDRFSKVNELQIMFRTFFQLDKVRF
jgi:hypothetical protein